MDATAGTAGRTRATAQARLRRPSGLLGPKRRAFPVAGGEPVEAAHALAGAGLYVYGGRAVHRKRRAGAPPTEDRSWYFAFAPHGRGERGRGERTCGVTSARGATGAAIAAITPTRAMLQAILCDKRFVQCRIEGAPFAADLTDVVCRDRTAAAAAHAPDVSARAVRASDPRLNGRPLDIVITVTGTPPRASDGGGGAFAAGGDWFAEPGVQVSDGQRGPWADGLRGPWADGRACLEICVDRDERREADPEALEADLRAGLLAGAFGGRWLVGPDGAPAALRSVDLVRRLLDRQRAHARDELGRAQIELAAAQEQLCAPEPLPADDELRDRAALVRAQAEWDALLELADGYDRAHDGGVLVRAVAEIVAPALRDPRLRTRTQRLARIRAQLRAHAAPRHTGFMSRAVALERAVHARMSDAAVRRADPASRAAVAAASVARAGRRLGQIAAYRSMLETLERAGTRALAFPAGTSLRATIAYEHHRRFGTLAITDDAPAHAAL